MKFITAQQFLNLWLEFSQKHIESNADWVNQWNNNDGWSKFILGTKTSCSNLSPIGNFFSERIPNLKYRTENSLVDLTMSVRESFQSIPTLFTNHVPGVLETYASHYPVIHDVLFEHENAIYFSWHEVVKLTYAKSYLKVLVTYNSDTLQENIVTKENEMMFNTVQTILEQSSREFAENEQTEFLLLIGRKKENILSWTSGIFDSKGNPKT